MWRVALLAAVFAIDVVLFAELIREEVRDWRLDRRDSDARTRGKKRTGTS